MLYYFGSNICYLLRLLAPSALMELIHRQLRDFPLKVCCLLLSPFHDVCSHVLTFEQTKIGGGNLRTWVAASTLGGFNYRGLFISSLRFLFSDFHFID